MAKTTLKDLSVEDLRKKEKSHKVMTGIFIPIIAVLFFEVIKTFFNSKKKLRYL
jgi:hypothetical protein